MKPPEPPPISLRSSLPNDVRGKARGRGRIRLARGAIALSVVAVTSGFAVNWHTTSGWLPDADAANPALVADPVAPVVAPVATIRVEKLDAYTVHRPFLGRLEPQQRTELGFERAGRIDAVEVDEGDRVIAGAVLAYMDTARLSAREAELNAAVAATAANLALAKKNLARFKRMVRTDAASKQRLDDAAARAATLTAELALAKARVASNRVELAKSKLLAPFTGLVVRRHYDRGQVVATGQPVVTLIDDAMLEGRVGLAGPSLRDVRPGQSYSAEVNGERVTATVKALLTDRDVSRRTVDVLLSFSELPPSARPGDSMTLSLTATLAQPGFWIPLDAAAEAEHGLWSVLVVESNGRLSGTEEDGLKRGALVRRLVDIHAIEPNRLFVNGAVNDGDLVVRAGLHRVTPGQVVAVTAPDPVTHAALAKARR